MYAFLPIFWSMGIYSLHIIFYSIAILHCVFISYDKKCLFNFSRIAFFCICIDSEWSVLPQQMALLVFQSTRYGP